jgi:hypothetical protein
VASKPWSQEMSGRLVSLSGDLTDIRVDAQRRVDDARISYANSHDGGVASNIVFAGVACATGGDLRTTLRDRLQVDVIYTPLPEDKAHSDVVIFDAASMTDIEVMRDWLRRRLVAIRPGRLDSLVTACGALVETQQQPSLLPATT